MTLSQWSTTTTTMEVTPTRSMKRSLSGLGATTSARLSCALPRMLPVHRKMPGSGRATIHRRKPLCSRLSEAEGRVQAGQLD